MELRFKASELGCFDQGDVLICGASNSVEDQPYHYVAIQGWADSDYPDDEHRLHFEVDDQINGNYDLLKACALTRNEFTLELNYEVTWYPGVRRIVVDCENVTNEQLQSLADGLRRLFRDRLEDLNISSFE
jgi:hypothetical protein